jgi:hypothetical protein
MYFPMFRRLQTLWIFAGSLLVAGAAGGAHCWWTAPVYEAQATVSLTRGADLLPPAIGEDGELPAAVLADTVAQLAKLDVSMGAADDAIRLLARDIRCRVVPGTANDEATLRFRTTQPDQAVSVLRTVVAAWLRHIGRSTESAPPANVQSEIARLEEAVTRQKQHLVTLAASPQSDATATRQWEIQKAVLADVQVDLDEARQMSAEVRKDASPDVPLETLIERLSSPVVRNAALQLIHRVELEDDLRSQQLVQARYEQTYGRNHPQLRSVSQRVARLKQELGDVPVTPPSAYERLLVIVDDYRTFLEEHLVRQQATLADLESKSHRHAEREAALARARIELGQLELELTHAREQIAKSCERVATAEIIRPPMLLMQPVWPVPTHHAAASTVAGLVLGMLLVRRRGRTESSSCSA